MKVGSLLLNLLLAFTCSLTAPLALADILTPEQYPFPLKNPYFATATAAADHANMPVKIIHMEPRPERAHVPLMKGRNKVQMAWFQQKDPAAPLVFLVPGIGGGGESGSSLLLAEQIYKNGFSVITLPNPYSWQYVLGVSATTLPGYTPRDAVEYYGFLKYVTAQLKARYGVYTSHYALVGYSLGGLLGAHVAEVDSRQNYFRFDKVVLINPAIDIEYGIKQLDALYAVGDRMPQSRKDMDMGFLFTAGSNLITGPLTSQTIGTAMQKLSAIHVEDVEWLIGESFRESVQGVVYASQQVQDLGLLKQPATFYHQNLRLEEAMQVSLREYMEKYLLPRLPHNHSVDALLAQSSLYPVKSVLENPHVYVMENRDDLILKPTDVIFLKSSLGKRLYMYPYGGHIGNIWFEKNKSDLVEILKTP